MIKHTVIDRMEAYLEQEIQDCEAGIMMSTAESVGGGNEAKAILAKLREFVAEEQTEERTEGRGKLIAERVVEGVVQGYSERRDELSVLQPDADFVHGVVEAHSLRELFIPQGRGMVNDIPGGSRVRITYRIEEVE